MHHLMIMCHEVSAHAITLVGLGMLEQLCAIGLAARAHDVPMDVLFVGAGGGEAVEEKLREGVTECLGGDERSSIHRVPSRLLIECLDGAS